MKYFLLISIILLQLAERILTKQYNIKAKQINTNLFTAIGSLCALVFFIINGGKEFSFNPGIMPYAAAFAASFGTALVTTAAAIGTGPLSVTTLVGSYSLLIPTFYGILFLHEPVGPLLYIGLAALVISLYLINRDKGENMKFSPVWLVYLALSFVSNGMCSTVQKMQQLKFDGLYKNEFMAISLALVSAVLFIAGLAKRGNKREMIGPCLKYGAAKGLANGIVNYLVMAATAFVPNAVLFPSISAGGIILAFVCALTVYKEKLSKVQIAGYILGTVSVVLLNF